MASSVAPDANDDPIIASYNVFLQPRLQDGKLLLVLQHPNRQLTHEPLPPATQVRLKRNTGMVEVDIPTDLNRAYDRRKGQEWGSALQRSTAAKNGGSHGLAGGFSLGAPPLKSRRGEEKEDAMLDWNEALRTDKVLRTATHGGMAPNKDEANHLVGVFQGKNLHLTPTSAIINLRPQLHHIDAFAEAERRREAAAASAEKGPAGPAGGRAIHMTIKTDGNEVTTETMADRLKAIQSEKWAHLGYIDENHERAWDSYDENLIVERREPVKTESAESAEIAAKPADDEKGKAIAHADADPLEQLAYLRIKTQNEDDLLYAVSGRERPSPHAELDVQEVKAEPTPATGALKKSVRSKKK